MEQSIKETFERYIDETLHRVIISNSVEPERITKVVIRPVRIRRDLYYQATEYIGTQVMHKNYKKEELIFRLPAWFENTFRQAEIQTASHQVTLLISKKGKTAIKAKEKQAAGKTAEQQLEHNRKKKYILEEGIGIPFMEDLGVMTADGKVVKAKYDKYRQINRFLELVEDVLPALPKNREIKILDFGCGKSYLTFALYYFLTELHGYRVFLVGLDLKEEVIKHCSALAKRYGYAGLSFCQGDVASYEKEGQIDMMVTLHACDTATDYALAKAVCAGASVILSVPCCQHQLNRQIRNQELEPVLRYGIVKERMAALVTDALRAEMLELMGYQTALLEFIDMEHTPKNIMIRGIKTNHKLQQKKKAELIRCMELLHVEPELYTLLFRKGNDTE